jgi:chromate transporter
MIYKQLFLVFFKIGLFSFGGGYAMLPLIQSEVVEANQWIGIGEFTDIVAISQITPGPIAINSATYIGYTVQKNVLGALVATLGVCLPSIIIMLIICNFMRKFRNSPVIANAFVGLRPVVIGLITAAMLLLITKETFFDLSTIIIFAVATVATLKLKVNPILLTIAAGIVGLLLY